MTFTIQLILLPSTSPHFCSLRLQPGETIPVSYTLYSVNAPRVLGVITEVKKRKTNVRFSREMV